MCGRHLLSGITGFGIAGQTEATALGVTAQEKPLSESGIHSRPEGRLFIARPFVLFAITPQGRFTLLNS